MKAFRTAAAKGGEAWGVAHHCEACASNTYARLRYNLVPNTRWQDAASSLNIPAFLPRADLVNLHRPRLQLKVRVWVMLRVGSRVRIWVIARDRVLRRHLDAGRRELRRQVAVRGDRQHGGRHDLQRRQRRVQVKNTHWSAKQLQPDNKSHLFSPPGRKNADKIVEHLAENFSAKPQ